MIATAVLVLYLACSQNEASHSPDATGNPFSVFTFSVIYTCLVNVCQEKVLDPENNLYVRKYVSVSFIGDYARAW